MSIAAADAIFYTDSDNWLELPLRTYSQTTAPASVPRLASSIGETNLDGTFHHTFPVNHGFKKGFDESNQNYRVVGNYNTVDTNLYPPLPFSSVTTPSVYTGTSSYWYAKESFHSVTWWSVRESTTNVVYEINSAGSLSKHTLPAALSGVATHITSLCMHKGNLYHAVQNPTASTATQRRNTGTGVYQDIGGNYTLLGTLRDTLYGINQQSQIYAITNELAAGTATHTLLATAGHSDHLTDLPDRLVQFNGALWLAKPSGLYRFDGVAAVKVLDFRPQFLTVHNGALYFVYNGWLYRFNGSLLEALQYFGDAEAILDLESHANNLYILTSTNTTSFKFAGSSADGSIDSRIFEYDGISFRVIQEIDQPFYPQVLNSVGDLLLFAHPATVSFTPGISKLDFTSRYKVTTAGQPSAYLLTADFDGQLPNIDKLMRRLEVDVANMGASDTITLKTEVFRDNAWQAEITHDNLTAISLNFIEFPTQDTLLAHRFRAIRIRAFLNPALGSSASLRSVTLHYTVHPSHRYKFSLTAPITNNLFKKHDGNDYQVSVAGDTYSHTPLVIQSYLDRLFNASTAANFFLSPQVGKLDSTWTNTLAESFFVVSGNFYFGGTGSPKPYPLIAVKNNSGWWNIFRVKTISVGGATTVVTVVQGNEFGNTTVTANAGAEVRLCYLINDVSIANQNFIINENTAALDTYGVSQLERDLVLSFNEI